MLKYIYAAVIAGIIIYINFVWGSVISWMLSITIIAIIFYFVVQLNLEDTVNKVFQKKKKDISDDPQIGHKLYLFGKKWESILKFSALAVVFVAAAWSIITTTHPKGNDAWFLNNDYHGISNTGIAFDQTLPLKSASSDSNAMYGKIKVDATTNNAQLTFDQYFVPVLKPTDGRKGIILNNIFPQAIQQKITLQNSKFKVQLGIAAHEPNIFKKLFWSEKDGLLLTVDLEAYDANLLEEWNLTAPFKDQLNIKTSNIEIGRNFFEFILNNQDIASGQAESYQVLETLLQDLGDSYILVQNDNGNKSYKFFPSKKVFDNQFSVAIDGVVQKPMLTNNANIGFDEKFYIGITNFRKQLSVKTFNPQSYPQSLPFKYELAFDYPNTYMLKSPGKQEAGNKNIRFITNDLDKIIEGELKEGFLFNTYNLLTNTPINGALDYFAGKPNSALHLNISDNHYNATQQQLAVANFTLATQDKSSQYLFNIRDFSQNGFSTEKSVSYLAIIFLAFVILTTFFPGKKLERIEPIILMVIMALAALRFILYWRVATFPPLENISKHELENTLINFDFNLGFAIPFPLTLLWIIAMVIGLILWRTGKLNFLKQLNLFDKINFANTKLNINVQYAIFIIGCFAIYFINKKITHIEILVRVITILVPLLGYIYFSTKANANYQYIAKPLKYGGKKNWLEHLHAYVYYFFYNPTSIITLLTLGFFALTDRGFAILFFLFLLLKNILINFLKKPLANSKINIGNRLLMPQNFWIYAILALIAYLCLLAIKPLFYYALTYKVWVVLGILALATLVVWLLMEHEKWRKIALGITALWALLAIIPVTNKLLDEQMGDVVKHVQYRASIIYQPIHEMLQANEYTSFKTQKIIETAENQWFINSYISKPYDNNETINLRAHSRVGVDYSTQTRDVVLARYVISEWGDLSMYLILIVLMLPMVLYLIAYRFVLVLTQGQGKDVDSYAGLIPLLILFTIALFVWLTATNRFVFFGQDFPFLSLTSKLSVLLPILLWFFSLTKQPTPKHSFHVDFQNNAIKYTLFIGLIAVFALTTVQKNELNNDNFSIVMETTKSYIEHDLNGILDNIQDNMESKGQKLKYNQIINQLAADTNFIELKDLRVRDAYTQSILNNLIAKPNTAFQLNNPLFMVYDNGRYQAVYNKNLYLELPPIENRRIWQGNILESIENNNSSHALVQWNQEKKQVDVPFITHNPIHGFQFAMIPKTWIKGAQDHVGVLNIMNNSSGKTDVFIYKNAQKNMIQNATSFASNMQFDDVATLYQNNKTFKIGFQSDGNKFATNKWINGTYRIIYPLKEQNFWVYSYANAIRSAYSNDSMILWNNHITLDYELSLQNQKAIAASIPGFEKKRYKRFNFSVIGADGDGNIRFMNDFVSARNIINPNDQATIFALQQKQFFYSNARHERDQWGNRNLLNLYLGPGSSVKGLTVAAVSSQLNAGWEQLTFTPPQGEQSSFAGQKLVKPWINDEHDFSALDIPMFLTNSSNFYHLLYMFLGSYTKDDFGNNNQYHIKNVLTKQAGKNNNFPLVHVAGNPMYLKNISTKEWPLTDKSATHKSYFGNENSLIANGFENNLGLRTKDKDKLDKMATTNDRVNFVDSALFTRLNSNKNSGYLWGFPEESFFLQSDRAHTEIHQNANLGVFTPSLGGYPFRVTPYKMAEMYLSLFTQNNNLQLSIVPNKLPKRSWNIDESWNDKYNNFLASQVFTGLRNVITMGTAKRLNDLAQKHSQYFFYAKTGTINEQGGQDLNSRRLIVMISNKDLTIPSNIGQASVYSIYFAFDNTQQIDWNAVNTIINNTIASKSFNYYFNK